ncbi:MAG: 16S rRNA (uracil(1498)-N(3))-methyltransferase [Planctomycetes bacterium]|nr:16S rRNA (uracil(1498)-N(3))-methyltransferase [Planctomycetota bacterium]NUQ35593.1 16S rRNA (uracil(1498)-N(3))-methyltransferase [Planctomycetaceae bacterium]
MSRLNRFYCPDLPAKAGAFVEFTGDEAHHMITVLRMRAGQSVTLFDGKGRSTEAKIVVAGRKAAQMELTAAPSVSPPPAFKLTMAIAPMKADFDELLVRLAELGVSDAVPVMTEYGEVNFKKREAAKFSGRLEKLAVRAAKQSGNNHLISVADQIDLDRLGANVIVCDTEGERQPLHALAQKAGKSATVLIGPEGGFSESERAMFRERRYTMASLPGGVLRAATAAMVAASIMLANKSL